MGTIYSIIYRLKKTQVLVFSYENFDSSKNIFFFSLSIAQLYIQDKFPLFYLCFVLYFRSH